MTNENSIPISIEGQISFEDFLLIHMDAGHTDFRVVARYFEGKPRIYIHSRQGNSMSLDFNVNCDETEMINQASPEMPLRFNVDRLN